MVDLALLVALNDGGERVGQLSVRIDAVHFAGLDERGDDGPVLGSGVMTCEECILSVQRDGADGAFDGVVVDLDAAIGEEAAKALAVFRDVGECFAQGRFGRGAGAVVDQPVVDAGEDGGGALLPDGQSGGGGAAADPGFDGVEIADEGHALLGNRCG